MQNQKRNNSRADSIDSNRSKSDNNGQHYNGKFLKQFATSQENKLYIQAPNALKSQHRQSAGQILKPLKEPMKIHSEQQATRFNINPYADDPNAALDHDQAAPGSDAEPSKTPAGPNRQSPNDPASLHQIARDNNLPNKRNRSYTRGRKSGARNQ